MEASGLVLANFNAAEFATCLIHVCPTSEYLCQMPSFWSSTRCLWLDSRNWCAFLSFTTSAAITTWEPANLMPTAGQYDAESGTAVLTRRALRRFAVPLSARRLPSRTPQEDNAASI